ncbi:hypothetical protein ACP4OV_003746 [Aristida adscensionis]
MRGGGRGRGRGGGGGGGGRGPGRRDARAASRDDRDRRGDRRPEHRPRRSPSPDRRARRPRSPEDDDVRAVARSGRMEYGGGYRDRDRDRDLPRGGRAGYGGGRDPSPGRGRFDYDVPGRGRRDYGGDRDGSRRDPSPRDYGRAPYRPDRYDRIGRGGDRDPIGGYEAPPAYILRDHPADHGRSYLRAGKKEDDYLGGPSDRSFDRDSKYFGGPRHRSIDKESELFGDGGALKISVTESGRTSSLYQHRGSPQRVALSPPPPLYPSIPPAETGFLTGGSSMELGDGFGSGKTRSLHDGVGFKNHEHLIDPYARETRETKRDILGSRDVLLEKDGGTDRLYPVADMPLRRDRETDRLYSSRDILGSDLGAQVKQIGDSSSSLPVGGQPYRMHTEPGYEPSNGYNMDGFGRLSHDSLGHGSGYAHRFSGGSLEHGSDHGDEALLDGARHAHSKHEPRSESLEYDAREYARRGLYVASENLPGNASQNSRHISGSASLRGLKDERINHHRRLSHRMEEDEDSFQGIHQDMERNMRPSYEGEPSVHYQQARSGNDRYSHSPGPVGFARRSVHHELTSFEDGHDLSDREVSPVVSRKRYRSPACHDRDMDMHQADGFTAHGYYSDDMDTYDLSSPRMSRRYDIDQMVDDDDEYDAGYDMRTSHDVFSRLALPRDINDEWADVDYENNPHLVHGRPNHKPMSQRLSIPNGHSQFGGPYVHGRGRGRGRGRGLTKSAKKRMRMSLHQYNDGYTPERNDITRPNKFSKSSKNDPNGSELNHEDAPEDEDLTMQKDPSEGSEEFSRQVHQAFLKYAKILNESQAMQKRYLDAPKGSLSCCVCGSVARKFPDVDALLSHAYDTCKVGLKTKHLGFHKALCVLMGWNWHVAPDTAKAHHYIQAEEVNAMKGDLMLWPPVVIIHNISIAKKTKDTEAKVVSIEEIKGVVADIGVACGKARVSHGRPANQSVFLVKFQPTISGFQEAMKVHGHFATRNHGKEEFQQMKSGKGKQAVPIDNLEELLYAHIGVAEDLGYLDEETKKRCVIRSKKDTQASADAALNLEP